MNLPAKREQMGARLCAEHQPQPPRKFIAAAAGSATTAALRYGYGFAALGALAVLFLFNPAEHGFFPPCLFHKLTGLNCPGCGATRAAHELLHGNFVVAVRDNALLVGAVICGALLLPLFLLHRWRGKRALWTFQSGWLWLLLAVMLVFTVWRNLPAGEWLSP